MASGIPLGILPSTSFTVAFRSYFFSNDLHAFSNRERFARLGGAFFVRSYATRAMCTTKSNKI